jgi:hypothetical protein
MVRPGDFLAHQAEAGLGGGAVDDEAHRDDSTPRVESKAISRM